jgi:hypothetical protein
MLIKTDAYIINCCFFITFIQKQLGDGGVGSLRIPRTGQRFLSLRQELISEMRNLVLRGGETGLALTYFPHDVEVIYSLAEEVVLRGGNGPALIESH